MIPKPDPEKWYHEPPKKIRILYIFLYTEPTRTWPEPDFCYPTTSLSTGIFQSILAKVPKTNAIDLISDHIRLRNRKFKLWWNIHEIFWLKKLSWSGHCIHLDKYFSYHMLEILKENLDTKRLWNYWLKKPYILYYHIITDSDKYRILYSLIII